MSRISKLLEKKNVRMSEAGEKLYIWNAGIDPKDNYYYGEAEQFEVVASSKIEAKQLILKEFPDVAENPHDWIIDYNPDSKMTVDDYNKENPDSKVPNKKGIYNIGSTR
jgi:hypothetical protein